ncbi:uncharacterized protein [Lolium perenne]|uniref:uncharacterized protein n=1 Tax=Lolium perenne TaxID=4522 RepID=UPI0021F5FCC1|nr:uncharacterized protein LOC127323684 [Lolium perenne]
MENKVVSRVVITGVLMLCLGLLHHAQALGCSPSQLQCIEVCDDEDIPHEQCVKECGCSELNLLFHSKPAGLGLQRAQVGGCSPSQIQCVEVCDDEGTPHETCVKECGCSEVNLLHSKAAGQRRCRLGCSSKCNHANKLDISAGVKEQCKDVCDSLCAKGIDIAATAA